MTNREIIVKLIKEKIPTGICDDCISQISRIQPRQQVNQICNQLSSNGLISRKKSICCICKKIKTVNTAITGSPSNNSNIRIDTMILESSSSKSSNNMTIDIEGMRAHIVRFCKELWMTYVNQDPPISLPKLISGLKDNQIVTTNPSNMMLTINNLRNAYTYEKLPLGANEVSVAQSSWDIVSTWAQSKYPALWQKAAP